MLFVPFALLAFATRVKCNVNAVSFEGSEQSEISESITIANFTLTNNITNPNVFAHSDGQMMFIKFQKSKWDRI